MKSIQDFDPTGLNLRTINVAGIHGMDLYKNENPRSREWVLAYKNKCVIASTRVGARLECIHLRDEVDGKSFLIK